MSGQGILKQSKLVSPQGIQLLGECHPLVAQLGSADGLFTLSGVAACLSLPRVDTRLALGKFLKAYQAQILLDLDWPAILGAHGHASRNEARELVALDLQIAERGMHRDFASASRRIGRSQLERLRPLRDARVIC